MSVYAIGDVHGYFDELMKLLDIIRFDSSIDQIWLAGDLVNRGPNSADVLRFAMDMGPELVKVVLGNHDLYLLASSMCAFNDRRPTDAIKYVLEDDDRDELILWLRHQRLFHHDNELAFSMVHAGVPAEWSITQCQELSSEVEVVLQLDGCHDFFQHINGNTPQKWSESLIGWDRLRYIINCFTRLRYCHLDGGLALDFKGHPKDRPDYQLGWFDMPNRKSHNENVVFGHWSTLGTGQYGKTFSLDGGVAWGGFLTAVRIDMLPYEWFTVPS